MSAKRAATIAAPDLHINTNGSLPDSSAIAELADRMRRLQAEINTIIPASVSTPPAPPPARSAKPLRPVEELLKEEWLNVPDAARIIRMSASYVWEIIYQDECAVRHGNPAPNQIPFARRGRRVTIPTREFVAWSREWKGGK